MIIIAIPLLVCLVGLVIYLATEKPKVMRIGEIMFFTGLLVTLFALGHVPALKL
jgi:Na+/phosphate symporter